MEKRLGVQNAKQNVVMELLFFLKNNVMMEIDQIEMMAARGTVKLTMVGNALLDLLAPLFVLPSVAMVFIVDLEIVILGQMIPAQMIPAQMIQTQMISVIVVMMIVMVVMIVMIVMTVMTAMIDHLSPLVILPL
jgi:hypothetical protein